MAITFLSGVNRIRKTKAVHLWASHKIQHSYTNDVPMVPYSIPDPLFFLGGGAADGPEKVLIFGPCIASILNFNKF